MRTIITCFVLCIGICLYPIGISEEEYTIIDDVVELASDDIVICLNEQETDSVQAESDLIQVLSDVELIGSDETEKQDSIGRKTGESELDRVTETDSSQNSNDGTFDDQTYEKQSQLISISLIEEVPTLKVGDSYKIKIKIISEGTVEEQDLMWSSSNPQIATVDAGTIIGRDFGVSVISGYLLEDQEVRITIPVLILGEGITTDLPVLTTSLEAGESAIQENLFRIKAIETSALWTINELQRKRIIGNTEATKRRSIIKRAFKDYAFPWNTNYRQKYWKKANSDNGMEDIIGLGSEPIECLRDVCPNEIEMHLAEGEANTSLDESNAYADMKIDSQTFPDTNFRSFVADTLDENSDGFLSEKELNAVTRIECDNLAIANLAGIEVFTRIQHLSCENNKLKTIDVSSFEGLVDLRCSGNRLKELDLTHCPNLVQLYCGGNKLTELDVSECDSLEMLLCSENNLEAIYFSDYPAIKYLDCHNNKMMFLDLSNAKRLEELDCSNNAIGMLNIYGCYSVKDIDCTNNALKTIDVDNCAFDIQNYNITEEPTKTYMIATSRNLEIKFDYSASMGLYDDTGEKEDITLYNGIQTIKLKKSGKKMLTTGSIFQLLVPGKKIKSCKTSNRNVASVTDKGRLTIQKTGKAKITVKLDKNKKIILTLTSVRNRTDKINKKPTTNDIKKRFKNTIETRIKSLEYLGDGSIITEVYVINGMDYDIGEAYCDSVNISGNRQSGDDDETIIDTDGFTIRDLPKYSCKTIKLTYPSTLVHQETPFKLYEHKPSYYKLSFYTIDWEIVS